MRYSRLFSCLFTGIYCVFSSVEAALEKQDQFFEEFQNYAQKALEQWKAPGMAIAIVKDNQIVFVKGFGVTEVQGNKKVDSETIFQIGSLSKSFTSSLAAILIDEKKFNWTDKVADLYPEFMMYDPWVTREFEVVDLFAQRSGLPERAGDFQPFFNNSQERLVHNLRFMKPVTSFRSQFAYQNVFFVVAEQLMQKRTGQSWNQLIQEKLFVPLKMQASGSDLSHFLKARNVAWLHNRQSNGTVEALPKDFKFMDWVYTLGPAGGINSNVLDMSKWIMLHTNDGQYDGKQIISKENIEKMHRAYIFAGNRETGDTYYALAWCMSNYSPYPIIWHNGQTLGAASVLGYIPQEKVGIVVLTNFNDTGLAEALQWQFFDMYFKKPNRDWSTVVLKAKAEVFQKAEAASSTLPKNSTPAMPLENYIGTYQSDIFGKIKIEKNQDKLVLLIGEPRTIKGTLSHWDHDIFNLVLPDFDAENKMKVNFQVGDDGQVKELTIEEFIGSFKSVLN